MQIENFIQLIFRLIRQIFHGEQKKDANEEKWGIDSRLLSNKKVTTMGKIDQLQRITPTLLLLYLEYHHEVG